MNVKFMSACLVMLGAAMACAERPPADRPAVTYDPNDPEKTRPIISREERESLGPTAHTWTGVVHPDVYPALERRDRTLASLTERMKTDKDTRALQLWLASKETEGTVYVQVHLKDKAAQRRVLATLKASEFYTRQLFGGASGLVGYATKEGLDKLAKNPDVTGVCVDDKPLPEGPAKAIYRDDLPPPKPGQPAGRGAREDRVEPDVYRAFELTDRAYVLIALRTDSLPQVTDKPSEMLSRNELRSQAAKKLRDRVLSTVSADEFWFRSCSTSAMGGFITREGLEKLAKHPDILRIGLNSLARPPERKVGNRFVP